MAVSIARLVALSLLRRSDSDAYAGGVRHVRRDQAFIAGDVWRGTLTSCHQNSKHLERRWRYFPVEVSIDRADPASGEVVATFVTHADHSFYELKGAYDADARRLFLKPVRGKIGESWEQTALRELREETGITATTATHVRQPRPLKCRARWRCTSASRTAILVS